MPDNATVPVTFEVDPEIATALGEAATHARVERLIRRTTRPAPDGVEHLFAAMAALSDDARRHGLTDEILEAELEAYNAERRDRPPTAWSSSTPLHS